MMCVVVLCGSALSAVEYNYAGYKYTECRKLGVEIKSIMLSIVMLSVVIKSIILNVVVLYVILLSIVYTECHT